MISGGDVFDNARIMRNVLEGRAPGRHGGLNAAAPFIAAGLARTSYGMARKSILAAMP
jgi:anthranilate phosphoribosyltransferase